MKIREASVATPLGQVLGWSTDEGVCVLGWEDHRPWLETLLERRFDAKPNGTDDTLAGSIKAYFAGDLSAFAATPLDLRGTKFQLRVWKALLAIPCGSTSSYGRIATDLKTGPRAVGSANGSNPVSIIVPCHRVIASNGALTGYAYGTHRKAWLLKHESLKA